MQDTLETQMALLNKDITYTKEKVNSIELKIDAFHRRFDEHAEIMKKEYITREEFQTVKNLVYGFVTLVLVAVVGAMVSLVVLK